MVMRSNYEVYAASKGIVLEYVNMRLSKSDIDSWPSRGVKMRFLNENGHDFERERAAKVFDVDKPYIIHNLY